LQLLTLFAYLLGNLEVKVLVSMASVMECLFFEFIGLRQSRPYDTRREVPFNWGDPSVIVASQHGTANNAAEFASDENSLFGGL
jgi:hypothetical protein